MIPLWQGASKIVYGIDKTANEKYIVALFPDKISVYRESTAELLFWIPGTYIDMAVSVTSLLFIDSNGEDRALSFRSSYHRSGEVIAPAVNPTSSWSGSRNLFLYSVNMCEVAGSNGFTFVCNYRNAMTDPKLTLFTKSSSYYVPQPDLTPYNIRAGSNRHSDYGYFFLHSFPFFNGMACSYRYPTTIYRPDWTPPGMPESSATFFRNWGPSYHHNSDPDMGVSYWDGAEFHTTTFTKTNRVMFILDGAYFFIAYTTYYNLYKYNPTTKVYEEVSTFNPSNNPLPANSKCAVMNHAAGVLLIVGKRQMHTMDLVDGSYVTINNPIQTRDIGYVSKNIYDPGTGKDKYYYYHTYPYTHLRRFNITTQTYSTIYMVPYFTEYMDAISDVTEGDTCSSIGIMAVETFSEGIVVFTVAGLSYGGQYDSGAARFTVHPDTAALTFLDTDLSLIEKTNGMSSLAKRLTYCNPNGIGSHVHYARVYGNNNFEVAPPYNGGGPSAAPASNYYTTVSDPTDLSKRFTISTIADAWTPSNVKTYVLSDFVEGDCMILPDQIIDVAVLSQHVVFAVVKDGITWLLTFDSKYDWANNSKLARGGIVDKNLINDIQEGVTITNQRYHMPYSQRQSEPITSLDVVGKYNGTALIVNYTSGKSMILPMGDLLE